MEQRTSLHDYILADLRARLLSEHIAPGSRLPSIPQLMLQYNAGRSTIRDVLAQLQENGFVELNDRRAARARLHGRGEQWKAEWEATILRDRFALLGSYFTMTRIMPAILMFSVQYCSAQALPGYADALSADAACTAFSGFLEELLASAGIAVQRLLPAFLLHSALPYFWDQSSVMRASCHALVAELGTGHPDDARVTQNIGAACASVHCIVRKLAAGAGRLPKGSGDNAAWVLFPEIGHCYTQIALDLLIRIGTGGWSSIGMLPSERKLSEHYAVSVCTVREALDRLESAGFTHTINGRGTLVSSAGPDEHARQHSDWLEELLLCALHAGQLTTLVMPTCAREAAERTTPEDLRALENTFKRASVPIRSLFHFVVHRQRLQPLRTILQRAGTLCDWGLTLAVAHDRAALRSELEDAAWTMLGHLEANRPAEFAQALTDLYRGAVLSAKDTLVLQYGSGEARAVHLP